MKERSTKGWKKSRMNRKKERKKYEYQDEYSLPRDVLTIFAIAIAAVTF